MALIFVTLDSCVPESDFATNFYILAHRGSKSVKFEPLATYV